MNIFKRKTNEHDPYQFDPTRSSVSLALVLLLTLGLAWLHIQGKKVNTDPIELLTSFSRPQSGLSSYIPAEPRNNYYLLSKNGQPVGFISERIAWRDKELTGVVISGMPGSGSFMITDWRTSDDMTKWVSNSRSSDMRNPAVYTVLVNDGKLGIIQNNKAILHVPVQDISYCYVPNFLSDYFTSIGLSKYPKGLSFDFDYRLGEDRKGNMAMSMLNCTVKPADAGLIPDEIRAMSPDGKAVSAICAETDMIQYFTPDHKLLYQKYLNDSLKYDITTISDMETILGLWPEARWLLRIEEESGAQEI